MARILQYWPERSLVWWALGCVHAHAGRLVLAALIGCFAGMPLAGQSATAESQLEARLRAQLAETRRQPGALELLSFAVVSSGTGSESGPSLSRFVAASASGAMYRWGMSTSGHDDEGVRALGWLLTEAGWSGAVSLGESGSYLRLPRTSGPPWFRYRLVPECERALALGETTALLALEGIRSDGPTLSGPCGWNATVPAPGPWLQFQAGGGAAAPDSTLLQRH